MFRPPDEYSYAYLLGLYLGDGCISETRRTYQLVVSCDAAYPELVERCRAAVQLTATEARVHVRPRRRDRCVRVEASWTRWPEAFPQHGPGRKHERPIVLADWQQAVVAEHPWPFLAGLLHSDGCRTVNRFSTTLPSGRVAEYAYPRWFFSNRSEDILGSFCATCDRVGIRWTRSNHRNVSVSHRYSVGLLDAQIGMKA